MLFGLSLVEVEAAFLEVLLEPESEEAGYHGTGAIGEAAEEVGEGDAPVPAATPARMGRRHRGGGVEFVVHLLLLGVFGQGEAAEGGAFVTVAEREVVFYGSGRRLALR
jgi:hypothetical protein